MEVLVCLFLFSFCLLYITHRKTQSKRLEKTLEYHFEFGCDEVFRGEYLYLDQIIENTSSRAVSFLKIETLMPQGLEIVLNTATGTSGKDQTVHSAESIWTLAPHSCISRRWRVIARTRGIYTAEMVEMHAISNDILGMGEFSLRLQPETAAHSRLLVLPCAEEALTNIALSPTYTGEQTLPHGLIHDPMSVCGVREYEIYDPLNSVDWKQSAHVGKLMVRQLETIRDDRFNIVLNMQSLLIEPEPPAITSPALIEDCITVCASLLDSAVRRNIPVRLFANVVPDHLPGGTLREDGIGSRVFCSEEFRNGESVIEAYRVLAQLPMKMSVPIEQMMDDMLEYPQLYMRGEHIVLVTAYLDQRMVNFYDAMKQQGVNVVFFTVTPCQNTDGYPENLPIWSRLGKVKGGTGYGW